jgi:prepilin-type N-terminal cleavage/methylation domain-containing protein
MTPPKRRDQGFALPELMISLTLVLIVFGAAMSGLNQMSTSQQTIWNRTQMHGGVRGATELMQQEIGQAGLAALPTDIFLTAAVPLGVNTVGINNAAGVTPTLGLYNGLKLAVGADGDQETITLTGFDPANNTITAYFAVPHPANTPVRLYGGFPHGIVPPAVANGSTASILKLFGDVNGDGRMVYVEYRCDWTTGLLYRTMVPWNATTKPLPGPNQILLTNVIQNPNDPVTGLPTPCFTYQPQTAGLTTYITGVAITLTSQTQRPDPITKQFQTETKALLNVAPRNVIHVWHLGSLGYNGRIQPTPPTITALLPNAAYAP